jgi:hypothetical protein
MILLFGRLVVDVEVDCLRFGFQAYALGIADDQARTSIISEECKRLAKADFLLSVISQYRVRDKSIPRGYLSTGLLW